MSSTVGAWHLFLLGLASGFAVLTLTAYRRVSPRWLKWLLMVTGLLMLGRYVRFASLQVDTVSPRWFANGIGLTLPGVFAVDQLVRHPAMTPKKLLRWYSPWAIAYGVTAFTPWWRLALPTLTGLFILAFLWICGIVIRKLPDRRIRLTLVGLCLAYLLMGVSGGLFAEMLVLLALWSAFETANAS